jgi:alpha-L-fucosidase
VKFEQDRLRVRFLNLPANTPDSPVPTIAVECESEPKQDNQFVRRERDRLRV